MVQTLIGRQLFLVHMGDPQTVQEFMAQAMIILSQLLFQGSMRQEHKAGLKGRSSRSLSSISFPSFLLLFITLNSIPALEVSPDEARGIESHVLFLSFQIHHMSVS